MSFHPSVVLLTNAVALPATAVLWALRIFQDKAQDHTRLAVITHASQLAGNLKLETSSLDAVLSLSDISGFHSLPWLVDLQRMLKPGGIIVVQELQTGDMQTKEVLDRSLLLAGYVNSEALDVVEGLDFAFRGNSSSHFVTLRAEKPTWETGSSFTIKKLLPMPQGPALKHNGVVSKQSYDNDVNGNSTPTSSGVDVLKLPTFEVDDDLVDEDGLLTEDDLKKPELPKVDDCEVGNVGRKACKNCACGRAQLDGKERKGLTAEELNNPQSACGNCGLGDAFRCSGCPYRGLAPFKLGEKIVLPGTLVTADV